MHKLLTSVLIVSVLFFLPCEVPLAKAQEISASLLQIDPLAIDVTESLSTLLPSPSEGVTYFVFAGEVGTTYTATFSVSEEPGATVGIGTDIADLTYDQESGTITIVFEQVSILDTNEVYEGVFVFAFVSVANDAHPDLIPEEARGVYLGTNLLDWELITPEDDSIRFGFRVRGPKGNRGLVKMFLPARLINFLGELAGEPIDVSDLAVFNGSEQVSLAVSEVNGGALIDLEVTLVSTSTEVIDRAGTNNVPRMLHLLESNDRSLDFTKSDIQKDITLKRQKLISLTAKNLVVSNNRPELYGFVKDKQVLSGTPVLIQGRVDGRWKRVGSATVSSDGGFTRNISPRFLKEENKLLLRAKSVTGGITSSSVKVKQKE